MADEVRPIPASRKELAQGERILAGRAEQPPRAGVEDRDGGEHGEVLRPGERTGGREEPARAARPGVFQPAALAAHRHAHLGVAGGDPKLTEQAQQAGIGTRVVDDEAGVEGHQPAVTGGDVVGVGVAAQPVVRLVQRDVVGPLQQVGSGQARHAGPDHGGPWPRRPRAA
jgi:hypothetical protein